MAIKNLNSLKEIKNSYDAYIVGSGIAGITLAISLEQKGFKIAILEAGHSYLTKRSQAIYHGKIISDKFHPELNKYRFRQAGGTSGHWAGRCVEFDIQDFERSANNRKLWPIKYEDIAKYYPKARDTLDCSLPVKQANVKKYLDHYCPKLLNGFTPKGFSENNFEYYSKPTNLFKKYKKYIKNSKKIDLFYNAYVVSISNNNTDEKNKSIKIFNSEHVSFSLDIRLLILATGGLETTRLLLTSGFGNSSGFLGKGYMSHIAGTFGFFRYKKKFTYGYAKLPNGIYARRRFYKLPSSNDDLGFIARIHFPKPEYSKHKSPILSCLYLFRVLIGYEYGLRIGFREKTKDFIKHFLNITFGMWSIPIQLTKLFYGRFLTARKIPPLMFPVSQTFSLDIHAEQTNWLKSEVGLGDEKDEFGIPRLVVNWNVSRKNLDKIKVYILQFINELKKNKDLEVEINQKNIMDELLRYGAYGGHHIGLSRMGSSPKNSVVNRNLELHDLDNTYILSSSVFPTSSQANPTLTITALAHRLSDYIEKHGGINK